MKKFAIPMLIGLILSAFAFTGCNETLIAPEDEWCVVTTKVQNQDIDLYFYYTKESGNKVVFNGSNEVSLKPGLTIVAIGTTPSAITPAVAFKQDFETNQEVTLTDKDGNATDKKITFKATMWDALYIKFYKKGIRKTTADGFKYCTEASKFSDLGNQFKDMSWKEIVIEVLELI